MSLPKPLAHARVSAGDLLARAALFLLGALSIASLLLYFFGVVSFRVGVAWLLTAEVVGLAGMLWWARATGQRDPYRRLTTGLWAGGLATLAYDVVRIPISYAGIPVFKAISYFGTVLLGIDTPTLASEVAGWTYHLSNGVSFGLMYAALVQQPRLVTAVLWGCTLEVVMLLTPYAEVFGYQLDRRFVAITLGAHAVYGVGLWLGLRPWMPQVRRPSAAAVALYSLSVPLGITGIAADFHVRHGDHLAASPPPYIGPHLYTTWDVAEPDRVAAMWVMHRFVDPQATFHFIPPFSTFKYGHPFDLPEAEVRREGGSSATEVILSKFGLQADERLQTLAAMTHLVEVTPWLLQVESDAMRFAQAVRAKTQQACGGHLTSGCVPALFEVLDDWYKKG